MLKCDPMTFDSKIEITVDQDRIQATLVRQSSSLPGVLLVHGWGGNQMQYLTRAREIARLGRVCLTFDLRGHAANVARQESVTREDNLRDVIAAYDTLASQPMVDTSAIAVVGSSYGGYLSAILTTVRPVKWLSLRAPALYPDEHWEQPKREVHRLVDLAALRREVSHKTNRALRACELFRGDVLIVESELDDIVPQPVIMNYIQACTRANSVLHHVIKGADHGLAQEASQRVYTTLLVNWLTEMERKERKVLARSES
jgi:dienelactone hydrolase